MAGKIREKVPGWTRTHGFFVIMGGFHLFQLPDGAECIPLPLRDSSPSSFVIPSGYHPHEDEVAICPLQIDDLPKDVLEFITPTVTELRDRGKSDVLAKLIVLVQTLWFVIQCIARGTQHLRLTELEVVTLAYTMLNFFIYALWWDKPRNIECPIRVYKSSAKSHKSKEGIRDWEEVPVLHYLMKIGRYSVGAQDLLVDISKQSSIPMFWSGRLDQALLAQASIGPTILGAAFGAIHLIAWSYEFPSHPELVLWRISCIAMTVVPLFATLACIAGGLGAGSDSVWFDIPVVFSIFSLILSSWLYVAGRIATLAIAFTTIRSLPSSALDIVDWITFIPHI